MANTKIPSELSSTPSISDSGNATAITIDSSERVGIKKTPTKELDVAGTIKAVGATNNNTMEVFGAETSNQSFGLLVNAGTSTSDYSALFRDEDANTILKLQGDGNVTISKGLTVGTTVQPTSGELDGVGQSGTNVITIGDTTKLFPAILMRSSATNGSWLGLYGNTPGNLNTYNTDTNRTVVERTPNGEVTLPNQPSFHAHTNASGTTGFITFTSTYHNIGSHYDTSNGRFTAPVAGRYLFTFAVLLNPDANGEYCRILFAINGNTSVTYGDTLQDLNFSSLSDYHAITASTILSLSANDYVQIKNDSQFGTYGGGYGNFCGQLLS